MVANRPGAQENLVLFLSLIPYVMDRGEVSVEEAAKAFGRHPSDIHKAVELIACSGIPGDTSAYLHADLFDIDWDRFLDEGIIRFENTIVIDSKPAFSAREMSALIAGLQYLSQHPAWAGRPDVARLLAKLGASGSTLLVKSQPSPTTLDTLRHAISEGRQVLMDYVNKRGERESRSVDPLAVESRDDVWFFRGWCHLREALRTFRVDRIATLTLTDTAATNHDDALDPDQWSVFEPSDHDLVVEVEFSHDALPLIAEYLDRSTPPTKHGATYRATVPFAHLPSLTRFVGRYPGLVTAIGPQSARAAVASFADDALANYGR
jgi:proteasome accessory factor C